MTACPSTDNSGNPKGDTNKPTPQQLPHPVGDPVGDATFLNIGPGGGTLTSDDGQLILTVPPGALTTAVDLSVQPLSNTANGGLLNAWRLRPQGQTFKQPVTISFNVPMDTLGNIPAGVLGIAKQRSDGHWRWDSSTTYDGNAKTATGNITDTSEDLSLVYGFDVTPYFQKVAVGGTTTLFLSVCYAPDLFSPDKANEPMSLGYECDNSDPSMPLPLYTILRWNVDGVEGGNDIKGKVAWKDNSALAYYTAPNARPDPDTVSVSSEIPWKDKGLMVVSGLVAIDPPLRVFTGVVQSTYSDAGLTVSLSGDITWTETEGVSPGTFEPTGAADVTVNMDGYSPYVGQVNVQGGQLFTNVPSDGLYSFTIGFDSVLLNCGAGVTIPYSGLMVTAPCNETDPAPTVTDSGKTMTGSNTCNGASQTWSFSQVQ